MEMMIAISIFTIGIAGFTLLFYRSWQSNSFIIEEGVAATQASNTVNRIAIDLRGIRQSDTGGYMIESAGDDELVVYLNADDDDNIERVRYFLDDDNDVFKKGVAEASGSPLSYPADYSGDAVTTLANYVVNSSGTDPVFIYYDNENSELPSPTLTDIRVIEVVLFVNIKPESAPDNVKIGTSVELRNLDENI